MKKKGFPGRENIALHLKTWAYIRGLINHRFLFGLLQEVHLKGALVVGSPQQVIDKILYEHELFGNMRFLAQMSMGDMPHDKVMRSIELFATKVAPAIRQAVSKKVTAIVAG